MFYRARGDIILELIGIKPTPGERWPHMVKKCVGTKGNKNSQQTRNFVCCSLIKDVGTKQSTDKV